VELNIIKLIRSIANNTVRQLCVVHSQLLNKHRAPKL